MGGHANRLQARRAIPVDRDAGNVVEPGQPGDDATDVEARLTSGLTTTHDEVLDVGGRHRRHLGHQRGHDLGRHVVGPEVDERTLAGTPDRATGGGDDHCFGHAVQGSDEQPTATNPLRCVLTCRPMSNIVALDVGGTSIKSGVVSLDLISADAGDRRADDAVTLGPSIPTRSTESADVVLGQLAEAVTSVMAVARDEIVGLAIAFPGPFDVAGGRRLDSRPAQVRVDLRARSPRRAPCSIGTHRLPRAGLPIEFARDSESAGMGEAVFGAGVSGRRVLTVTIGTGLGACLTDDGRVIEVVGELEIEKLARRPTVDGRADDVLSARGLADRLGVDTAELQVARRRADGGCGHRRPRPPPRRISSRPSSRSSTSTSWSSAAGSSTRSNSSARRCGRRSERPGANRPSSAPAARSSAPPCSPSPTASRPCS